MTDNSRDINDPIAHLRERPDPEVDRERLIEELMELKALTYGFFESVPGAFIVLDSRWCLVYLNGDAKKMFTDNEASLIGRPLEAISPKIFGHILAPQVIKPLLEGTEKTALTYSNLLHKWFKISAYESESAVFIRLEDVTKEQITSRLLRLNEFSVNRAKDMVFWAKTGGHIIYANTASCDSLKYSREDLVKMKMPELDPSFEGYGWTKFVDGMKRAGSMTYESSLRARDGSVIPVEVTCNYLKYGDDDYMMAFARDITARKRTEKALLDSKAEAELYVDLMGHDINNMNQIAMGFLELALDMMQTEGKIDNAQIDLIAKPLEMLMNSSQLIQNVRKIQREKAGHFESDILDVGSVLREVRDSYAQVPGRDIKIELNQNGECQVSANELLKDIFVNLVGNSIKHSRGPLLINIKMMMVADNGRSHCRVSVEDNGPGITDEMKGKLLHRLSPENTGARGKGLGLYLIKQLVDDFNGKFWMEDRVQGDYTKGARFVVMLPAVEK